MLCLGVGMFFAAKAGFSAAPLVLGLILGKLTEENFQLGRMIGDSQDGGVWSYFFTGTINIVLITLCVLSIIFSVYSETRKKTTSTGAAA